MNPTTSPAINGRHRNQLVDPLHFLCVQLRLGGFIRGQKSFLLRLRLGARLIPR
jgi:hypothetical protein